MKFKTTAKYIRSVYGDNCIKLGYCEACHLLRSHEPIAYTSGVYGWNFDLYYINGIAICTGYRGMIGSLPAVPVTEYEEKARKIYDDYSRPYNEREKEVNKLLREWLTACEEATK